MLREILKTLSGVIIPFRGTGYGTTAQQVKTDNGEWINYSCAAVKIQNLSTSVSLLYSFDGTNFSEVKPLGTDLNETEFDRIYVKSASSTVNFQGQLIKRQ